MLVLGGVLAAPDEGKGMSGRAVVNQASTVWRVVSWPFGLPSLLLSPLATNGVIRWIDHQFPNWSGGERLVPLMNPAAGHGWFWVVGGVWLYVVWRLPAGDSLLLCTSTPITNDGW